MGRVLGLDYGSRRVGLAVSDETQTLAREFGIRSPKELLSEIKTLVAEQGVERIVLGWPVNLSGGETEKTGEVARFELKLRAAVAVPIERADERLTTQLAKAAAGTNERLDSLAAQHILQAWLDRQRP